MSVALGACSRRIALPGGRERRGTGRAGPGTPDLIRRTACRRSPDPLPADAVALASLAPGTPDAEAAADALLMRAKACGLRLARCLRAAADRGGADWAGLRRVAAGIALSCAYTTETTLRRRHSGSLTLDPVAGDVPGITAGWSLTSRAWLADRMAQDPEALAGDLGLTERQAQVWVAYARGDTLAEIGRSLGLSIAVVHRHLVRAQERARQSWLAAYDESLRFRRHA